MARHEDEKDKKKRLVRERNKRNWMIFRQIKEDLDNVDIAAPEIETKPSQKTAKKEEKIWSAQLVSIRNRLDNSKRLADDRWNRFAGTSDGGGKGR